MENVRRKPQAQKGPNLFDRPWRIHRLLLNHRHGIHRDWHDGVAEPDAAEYGGFDDHRGFFRNLEYRPGDEAR